MKPIIKTGAFCLLGLGLLLLLGYACPIQKLTGFPCPGCNMITSLYWFVIKKNLGMSLYYHALLLPTLFMVILVWILKRKNDVRKIRFVISIWLILMIFYYLYRMLTIFPFLPMPYDWNSLLGILAQRFF